MLLAYACLLRAAVPLQVSATHLATMHWHSMWKIPVRHIIVQEQALQARGYTTEQDMELVNTIQAPCKANEYAMRLPEASCLFLWHPMG